MQNGCGLMEVGVVQNYLHNDIQCIGCLSKCLILAMPLLALPKMQVLSCLSLTHSNSRLHSYLHPDTNVLLREILNGNGLFNSRVNNSRSKVQYCRLCKGIVIITYQTLHAHTYQMISETILEERAVFHTETTLQNSLTWMGNTQ